MIGRADIEGSKSNVAMSACAVTQASYACGVCVLGGGGGGRVRHGPGGWVKDAPYFNQAGSVIPVVTFLTPLA